MPQQDSSQKLCYLYASATIILWSTPFVFTRIILQSYSAPALSVLRFISASLFLLIIAFIKKIGLPEVRDIPKFFLTGAMGFTIYMITFNTALQTINSATGSVIIATAPIVTAILAMILFHEKIALWGWFAIALEFLGIVVLMLWNGIFSIETGVLWMVLSAFLVSGYNISQRQFTKKYTVFQSTSYSIFAGTILLLIFLPQAIPQLITAPINHTLLILFLGVFPSSIAGLCWTKSILLARKTSDATNFMFATPLLSTIFAFFVADEVISLSTLIGGLIIIVGLVFFNTAQSSVKTQKKEEAIEDAQIPPIL